jgi:cell division protein FtsL
MDIIEYLNKNFMALPIISASLAILVLAISLILSAKETLKLKCRNRLLCRENHKLRIKLKEHEDGTKSK